MKVFGFKLNDILIIGILFILCFALVPQEEILNDAKVVKTLSLKSNPVLTSKKYSDTTPEETTITQKKIVHSTVLIEKNKVLEGGNILLQDSNIYLENSSDFFVDPYRELEVGQSRVFLTQQINNAFERDADTEQVTQLELEPGQSRVVLKATPQNDEFANQDSDSELVGDPYYLEPGQSRILLN